MSLSLHGKVTGGRYSEEQTASKHVSLLSIRNTHDFCSPVCLVIKQPKLNPNLQLRTPSVVELLVDAHELLDRVDVDARVLGVHDLHAFLAGDKALAFGDDDDVDEVAEDSVNPKSCCLWLSYPLQCRGYCGANQSSA